MEAWPPLSALYGLGDKINKWVKRSPQKIPQALTISIGNLTTGGTGKTPTSIYLAKLMQKEGFNVCVLSRGYRGSLSKTGAILSDGQSVLRTVEEAGDEPFLIAQNLPGVVTAVGRSRYDSAKLIRKSFQANLFILDDGFQHYKLDRDLDIVLIDATNPFGNKKLLPHGILREPLQSLRRSDIIIITKTNLVDEQALQSLESELHSYSGHDHLFRSIHHVVGLVPAKEPYSLTKENRVEPITKVKGKTVWALSAIGNHKAFEESLKKAGADSVHSISFRDHHVYDDRDIKSILSRVDKSDIIVTTEKDYVKLIPFIPLFESNVKLYYMKIEFQITSNELVFKEGLKAKLMLKDPGFFEDENP